MRIDSLKARTRPQRPATVRAFCCERETMYYGNVKYSDIANGEGVRTSLFVSGCTHHCKECFQPETWNFSFGQEFTSDVADRIIESLKAPWVEGLTVLGGEPMEPVNQHGLVPLLRRVRAEAPGKNIWCYTGDRFEALVDPKSPRHTDATDELLSLIDVLVDGPFERDLYDITLRFRGSSNQRLIDVPATLEAGEVVLWKGDEELARHSM